MSPLCDRSKHSDMPKSQCGFIDFVVKPLYMELEEIDVSDEVNIQCMRRLIYNRNKWDELHKTERSIKIPKRIMSIQVPRTQGSAILELKRVVDDALGIEDAQEVKEQVYPVTNEVVPSDPEAFLGRTVKFQDEAPKVTLTTAPFDTGPPKPQPSSETDGQSDERAEHHDVAEAAEGEDAYGEDEAVIEGVVAEEAVRTGAAETLAIRPPPKEAETAEAGEHGSTSSWSERRTSTSRSITGKDLRIVTLPDELDNKGFEKFITAQVKKTHSSQSSQSSYSLLKLMGNTSLEASGSEGTVGVDGDGWLEFGAD
eukprot:GHVN01059639.1.p1 GENE.GHVN01059639.1~~GHVN01059639.1.p1  ORF type:complete len:312 (-),score=69.59 GHVN01059639.1:22-957(-)